MNLAFTYLFIYIIIYYFPPTSLLETEDLQNQIFKKCFLTLFFGEISPGNEKGPALWAAPTALEGMIPSFFFLFKNSGSPRTVLGNFFFCQFCDVSQSGNNP
jgi:hypothetical protein